MRIVRFWTRRQNQIICLDDTSPVYCRLQVLNRSCLLSRESQAGIPRGRSYSGVCMYQVQFQGRQPLPTPSTRSLPFVVTCIFDLLQSARLHPLVRLEECRSVNGSSIKPYADRPTCLRRIGTGGGVDCRGMCCARFTGSQVKTPSAVRSSSAEACSVVVRSNSSG